MNKFSIRNIKAGTLFQIYTITVILVGILANTAIILAQIQRLSQSQINIQQFIWQTGGFVIAIITASTLVSSLLFHRLIGKPIQQIRESAGRIAVSETHLGEQIPEPVGAELRALTTAFNQMSLNLKTYTDETEKKITERTRLLEEGSRLVQEVLDTTPNLLCLMNTEIDELNYVNREFTDFFGTDNDEMIHLGPTYIRGKVHPMDQTVFKHHEQTILRSRDQDVVQSDFRMVNSQGDWRWISMRSVIFQRNHDGKVKLVLHVGQDITELKHKEEKLRFLSVHDQLTGLYNRLYFEEEMARLDRGRTFPISTIMADLDCLKQINDTYGHARGDEVLKAVTSVLRSSFRAEDVVARIGGDEFAALLPGANEAVARRIVERIEEKIRNQNEQNQETCFSLSIGTSTVEKGTLLADAIKIADERMYANKQARKLMNNGAIQAIE
jgi:diguanylate cyclase (GGDEF)-like protein/PAS domain S-box-containing protein